jgi:hypothetical protein
MSPPITVSTITASPGEVMTSLLARITKVTGTRYQSLKYPKSLGFHDSGLAQSPAEPPSAGPTQTAVGLPVRHRADAETGSPGRAQSIH